MCEITKFKAEFLQREHGDGGIPVFRDMKELHRGKAQDWSSGTVLPVPKASGLKGCLGCLDLF